MERRLLQKLRQRSMTLTRAHPSHRTPAATVRAECELSTGLTRQKVAHQRTNSITDDEAA
jgi:hypothetical protein